jgi:hypothetical protein
LDSNNFITTYHIPVAKILPGMALYGHSWVPTDPTCFGASCTFTSAVPAPGACGGIPGFLTNSEIYTLVKNHATTNAVIHKDNAGGSILVYDAAGVPQWVSFISPDDYQTRLTSYKALGVGGLADWVSNRGTRSFTNVRRLLISLWTTILDWNTARILLCGILIPGEPCVPGLWSRMD